MKRHFGTFLFSVIWDRDDTKTTISTNTNSILTLPKPIECEWRKRFISFYKLISVFHPNVIRCLSACMLCMFSYFSCSVFLFSLVFFSLYFQFDSILSSWAVRYIVALLTLSVPLCVCLLNIKRKKAKL